MAPTVQQTRDFDTGIRPAGTPMVALAWVLALGSVTFAAVNVAFELSGRFESGALSDYAAGLTVANWLVAGLKVVGASIAVLSVLRRPPLSPRLVNMLIWAAAGTLGIYALGSVVQAIGMATGLMGSIESIDLAGIVYVSGFLVVATGFVVLAVSHSRRSGSGVGTAVLGSVGGIVVLGAILFALPWLLTAVGIMPAG